MANETNSESLGSCIFHCTSHNTNPRLSSRITNFDCHIYYHNHYRHHMSYLCLRLGEVWRPHTALGQGIRMIF